MTSSWGPTWGCGRSWCWRVRLSGLSSYSEASRAAAGFQVVSCPSLCNDGCQGFSAELESFFMRQSTVALKECLASLARDVHFISSWLRIWQSHILCLGVACGILKWILREVLWLFVRNAGLDSGYMFCNSSWRFGRIPHNFYVDVDSNPEVFSLRSHGEWRSALSRCVRCLEIGNSMHECTWLALCMMKGRE